MLLLWTGVLTLYVVRLVDLAESTNRRYNNTGVLLTEQLNLYITMLRNPERKAELQACSNVIRIAIQLLKELESENAEAASAAAEVEHAISPLAAGARRGGSRPLCSGVIGCLVGGRRRLQATLGQLQVDVLGAEARMRLRGGAHEVADGAGGEAPSFHVKDAEKAEGGRVAVRCAGVGRLLEMVQPERGEHRVPVAIRRVRGDD